MSPAERRANVLANKSFALAKHLIPPILQYTKTLKLLINNQ